MLKYIKSHLSTGMISRVHLTRKFPDKIDDLNELIKKGILIHHPGANPTGEGYKINEYYGK